MEEFVKMMIEVRKEIMSFGAKLVDCIEKIDEYTKKIIGEETLLVYMYGNRILKVLDNLADIIDEIDNLILIYDNGDK